MIGALTNHLWQSTLVVLAIALVAAALRGNGAHIRHALWVAASLKFLVPFALLMRLGSALPGLTPVVAETVPPAIAMAGGFSSAVDRLAEPFTSDVFAPALAVSTEPAPAWAAIAASAAWACGFVAVVLMRFRGWSRVRAAVRASVPTSLLGPAPSLLGLPVRASPGLIEPGVVGVWRPLLLVPAGIERCLTPAQLRAVLEHELCHVRRRDNLTSAIQMMVEAVFWFHPLVWWVGARMLDERERACDEQVLRVCGEPETYAESILNVCKLYVESPVACVSGVTGSDLKKRVAAIVVNRAGRPLTFVRKAGLALAAALAIVLPVVAGVLTAPLGASPLQGAAASARFDVVSIKPCSGDGPRVNRAAPPSGGRGGAAPWAAQTSPGHVYWDCVTLAQLVEQAYADHERPLTNTAARPRSDSLQPKRVRGGPSWVERDTFTIEAKASVDVTTPGLQGRLHQNLVVLPATMSAALRAALEERFQVKVRRQTEQQDMYALQIAKTGLNAERIKATKTGDCLSVDEYFAADPAAQRTLRICGRYRVTRDSWEVSGMTLQQLANALSSMMDRFVVDRTGLDSPFTFVLELRATPEDTAPIDSRFARGLAALGLAIDETTAPAEYLVIDAAQRPRPDGPAAAVDPPARASGAGRR